jgi:hypothetical protein
MTVACCSCGPTQTWRRLALQGVAHQFMHLSGVGIVGLSLSLVCKNDCQVCRAQVAVARPAGRPAARVAARRHRWCMRRRSHRRPRPWRLVCLPIGCWSAGHRGACLPVCRAVRGGVHLAARVEVCPSVCAERVGGSLSLVCP